MERVDPWLKTTFKRLIWIETETIPRIELNLLNIVSIAIN